MSAHATVPGDVLAALENALRDAGFRGDLDCDSALRDAMSTDNSIYCIRPDMVAAPRDALDMVTLLKVMDRPDFADIPVTARGGGTGTNGQSLNSGVIIDTRRYMSDLIAIDTAQGWADVQPGMVLDDLNDQLRPTGWFFAPETSTASRCTIGGMVSTDASGKGSRVYGKTSDNLLGIEIACGDGLLSSDAPAPDWARPMLAAAEMAARGGYEAFIRVTPPLNRRFTGYDLERACPPDGPFEWWRLFPGSEGTLGLISRIRVKLTRIESEKRLIVAGFDGLNLALSAASDLIACKPTAIEVMDERVQTLAHEAGLLDRLPTGLRLGQVARLAFVFIEINGSDPTQVDARLDQCTALLRGCNGIGAVHVAADRDEIRDLWAIRSGAVGLLGKVKGAARPVAFVEDVVVPPESLPQFLDEFLTLLTARNLTFGVYGHADVGCLHIRPALNIDSPQDRAAMVEISDSVFALTRKFGGIFWGEHGKGVRGAYLREWIGPDAYCALQGVKAAFDPHGRFNPGKLVDVGERQIMGIATTPFRAFNAPEGDPLEMAFRCNGNAQCLSYAASTTMCPSFKATADLRQSPKGRADALRAWHIARSAGDADLSIREADLLKVLDTCLGCKACATRCPVQVDIPTMRSAFYTDFFGRHRRPFAQTLTMIAERYSTIAMQMAPVLAPIWFLTSKLFGALTSSRDLPRRMAPRLTRADILAEHDLDQPLPESTVILVQDWFTALFDAQAQRDALRGFAALGYRPRILTMRPAGKVAHGAGDMSGFEKMSQELSALLNKASASGAPLVAFEPAFGMMLRQEYQSAGIALPEVAMPQEFLLNQLAAGRQFPQFVHGPAQIFGHCTENAANPQVGRDWAQLFAALNIEIETPETGCCGMAGLFGHQRHHQAVSRKLFDLSWRNALTENLPGFATGFSCRCQAERLQGIQLRHPLGLIADLQPGSVVTHELNPEVVPMQEI
ncbi:FAD-binding and (Fe-S)-binding domain-containing protein [Roseinatronobacter sp.]